MNRDAEPKTGSIELYLLLLFVVFNFTCPQALFPQLQSLNLPRTLMILTAIFTTASLASGRIKPVCPKETVVVSLIFLLVLISITDSIWKGKSFELLFDMYLKVIVLYFLIIFVIADLKRFRSLLVTLSLCGLYIGGYAVKNYLSGNFVDGNISEARIAGPIGIAGGSNDMALTLVMILPMTYALLISSKSRLMKFLYQASIAGSLAGIVVSGSRGGLLALSAMIVFAMTTQFRGRLALKVLILALCFPLLQPLIPDGYLERMSTIVYQEKDETGSAQVRKKDMLLSLEKMKAHPFNGVGLGNSDIALLYGDSKGFGGVHNAFLQIGSECGIAAMLLLIYLYFSLYKRLSENNETRELESYSKLLQIALVGFLAGSFFLPLAYRWPLYYLAGIITALNIIKSKRLPETEGDRNESACLLHVLGGPRENGRF